MEIIGAALLAGLMGSPHCVGMCGGFAAACARPRGSVYLWHAGRLTSYAVLGAIAAVAGRVLPGPAWIPAALSIVLLLWFALALSEFVPQPKLRVPGLTNVSVRLIRKEGALARYLFGMATGLLPCGMVYAGLAIAMAARSPLIGALAMIAFGAGTVPALSVLSVGVQRIAARGLWYRRALAVLVLGAGLLAIARRVEPMPPTDSALHQHH